MDDWPDDDDRTIEEGVHDLTLEIRSLVGVVAHEVGTDDLLYRRLVDALDRGDIAALEEARAAFDRQPEAVKRRILGAARQ